MATYTFTYRCGHTAEIQLYGPMAERERKTAWYSTIDCPDCKAAAISAESHAMGMPDLQGSPKQIAWAAVIRLEFAKRMQKMAHTAPSPEAADRLKAALDNILSSEVDARFWIDHRDDSDTLIIKPFIK